MLSKQEQPRPFYNITGEFLVIGWFFTKSMVAVPPTTPRMTNWTPESSIYPVALMGGGPRQDHQLVTVLFQPHRHPQESSLIKKAKAQRFQTTTDNNRKGRLGMPLRWQPMLLGKEHEHFPRELIMNQSYKFCIGPPPTQRPCKLAVAQHMEASTQKPSVLPKQEQRRTHPRSGAPLRPGARPPQSATVPFGPSH